MSSTKEAEKADAPRKSKSTKTNGGYQNNGNLEDCYTNVFALTEVNGLKWKCYRTPSNAPRGVPLTSDPILKAYSKCVQDGILCAWRRKQLNMSNNNDPLPIPSFSHDMQKELWIFWYNDEPALLEDVCTDLEIDEEASTAASSNTVSYEVRIILFKALHVVMERSLMKNGFVRFGRWFTKPLKAVNKIAHYYMIPTYSIAVRFSFFVHGGNTICAVINAQRQPTLIQLHKRHLEHKNTIKRFAVIVGPWSMRGTLVQNQLELLSEPKMQTNAEREWNEWKEFVQLEVNEDNEERKKKNEETKEKNSEEGTSNEEKVQEEKNDEEKEKSKNVKIEAAEKIEEIIQLKMEERIDEVEPPTAENPQNIEVENKKDKAEKREKHGDDSDSSYDDSDIDDDTSSEAAAEKAKFEHLIPKMVLVEIDGVRMLYPSKYVCVTLEDDRNCLEALGHRISMIPDEIMIQGRRPRNKFVVQASMSQFPLLGVMQYISGPKNKLMPKPPLSGGFAQPFPPIDERVLRWKFYENYELQCDCCTTGKNRCLSCAFIEKRIKAKVGLTLSKKENVIPMKRILNQMAQKPDISAYHRTQNTKTAQIIKLKERLRTMSESTTAPSTSAVVKTSKKEEEDEGGGIFRPDCDDESWHLDDDHIPDWMNTEKNILPTTVLCNPEELSSYQAAMVSSPNRSSDDESTSAPPSPFTPYTIVSPCSKECNWPASTLENMSEKVFNQIFQANSKKPKLLPTASREEKYKEYDSYYNPTLVFNPVHTPEFASYHRKRKWKKKPKKIIETDVPFSKYSSFFKGEMCEHGAFGYKTWKSEVEQAKKAAEEATTSKSPERQKLTEKQKKMNEIIEMAEKSAKEKSVLASVRKLVRIKDHPANNYHRWKKNRKHFEKITESDLDDFDINSFGKKNAEDFTSRTEHIVGYMSPDFEKSPNYRYHDEDDEENEDENVRHLADEMKGLGEGTSNQFANGESMEIDTENENNLVESASASEHQEGEQRKDGEEEKNKQTGENINGNDIQITDLHNNSDEHGPTDGLLSPPASNEMPKSGPLSVGADAIFPRGPPSIEGQAMNQIYPTPPSVQMMFNDQQQLHSPVMMNYGKGVRTTMTPITEIVERVDVVGGTGTINEISSDEEAENLVNWKEKLKDDKFNKLLVKTKHAPLISNKRKTHLPLSEKFGVNEGNNKKSERLKKRNGVYPKMIDNAFENPPFDSFGKLLLPIHQPIIHNNFHGMANQPIPPIGFNGMPGPIGHHPSMMPQYQPPHGHLVMNQMNVFPPHPPPNNMPNQFVGPPHHHPMNIPPGPHGFGANGPMGPGGFGPHPNPNQFHMMPNIGPMGHPNRGMPMPPMYPPHRHQIVPSMLSAPGNRPPLGAPPAYGVPSMPPPPPSSSSISQQQQQQHQQQQQQQLQQQLQQQQQQQQQPQQPQLPPQPQGSQPMYQPVQQLNNFVNQARFGGNMMGSPGYGPPPPGFDNHAMMRQQQQQQQQHMFGQQPNMMGMANPMMSQQQQQQHHMMMRQQQQQQQQHQMQQSLGHPSNYPQPMTNQMPTISNTMMPFRSRDIPQIPEGESIVIAIILSDTILDLHFDTAMDSCPICACTVSIRARELGLYITPHEVLRSGNQMTRDHNIGPWSGFHLNAGTMCNCGFSAIRHRYLSLCAGLFPEDSNEATALENSVASVAPPLDLNHLGMEVSKNINWFDSSSPNDLAILDQIRQSAYSHSYGKAVTQMAALSEHTDKTSKAMDIGMDVSSSSEYVLSHVDSMELLMLGNSAIDMCMRSMSMSRAQPTSSKQFLTYFHPWGLQTANEIRDPNTNEWKAILGAVTPSLENSIRLARSITSQGAVNIVEGPLTWRKFVQKGLKNRPNAQGVEDETASIPEPVPAVTVATSNEILRAAPNIRSIWHQAQLAPVDQPKDVMYMTIIPDDDVAYTKTVKFMDIVTRNYEKMRLGKHIPFPVSSGAVNAKNRNHFANMRRTAVGTPMQHNFGIDPTEGGVQEGSIEKSKEAQKSIGAPSTRDKFQFTSTPNNADLDKPMATPMTWNDMKRVGGEKANNTQTVEVSEREGILRVGGTRQLPAKFRAHSAATSPEFLNLTKHLNDRTGFVTRLKMYAQQMEELVDAALQDNTTAFERYGFRYQVAIENRLKREKDAANMAAVKEKAAATVSENVEQSEENASTTDSAGNVQSSAETGENPSSSGQQLTSGNERGSGNVSMAPPASLPPPPPPPPIINQIPSPIPAGMVHIPETLPENERNMQPTLTELLSEPSSLLPHGAASIQWVQRDTTVPNPFPTSNQPPVDYEEVGGKEKDDAATLPHVIVIYITNPFTWGTEQHTAMHMRIALLTFIRTFNSIVAKLPPKKRPQLQLEIIGMEQMEDSFQSIPDYLNDPKIPMDLYAKSANSNFVKMDEGEKIYGNILQETARSLAVAVYSHPRVFFPDVYKLVQPRCMTAFGPGSQLLKTVDELERLNKEYFASVSMRASMGMRGMMNYHHPHQHHHHHHPMMSIPPKGYIAYKVPSNLWCLAPPPSIYQMEQDGKVAMTPMDEQVLFVSYCLVGSDYLVAAATDTQGRLVDSCVINMKPKHEAHQLYRFKQRTQILDTMGRLWTFILGVMASDIKNWRLVVGRLGRIGHGEFRAWTHLLNKTSLLKYSTRLKDICAACNQMPGSIGTPAVLSACLVTIEPEPNLRLFPDYFDTDFLSKKGRQLQTPDDVSCTHIITFPVGAEINYETQDQSTDTKAEENWDFGDLDIMEGLDEGDSELLKDVGLTETPQSAALRPGGYQSFFMDETANIDIQNQPLAAGYYVSTSPAPELPDWFWASCPSAKRSIPVHLKSSLHIHISEVKNDDIAIESTSSAKEKEKEKEKELHPLESHQTEEVLRHVLESYNALSWLNIDPTTGDRYSCMPIHIQHLLRLYHSIVRLIM